MVSLPVALRVCDPAQLRVKLLEGVQLISSARPREGGKPAAHKLLRPVKPKGKRADFMRWFIEDCNGRTVGATMANFNMSRPNVFAYWTMIHRDHGIGYTLSENTIRVQFPADIGPGDSVFMTGH